MYNYLDLKYLIPKSNYSFQNNKMKYILTLTGATKNNNVILHKIELPNVSNVNKYILASTSDSDLK